MSVITFWNNENNHIGQTSSILATATLMAIEHNYRILILSTESEDTQIEKAYGVAESVATRVLGIKDSKINSGMQGIMKLAYSNRLTPEMLTDYTKIILKNRLEVLAGIRDSEVNDSENIDKSLYIDIIKNANKFYDMVFIDLGNGIRENYKKEILRMSNIVVWNMEQKFEQVEKVLEFKEKNEVTEEKRIIYLINKYEKNSKYNLKNIIRNSKMKKNIYTIPYDIMFSDMIQDGTLDGWLLNPRIRKAKPLEEHGLFINETTRLCNGIEKKLQELHMLG